MSMDKGDLTNTYVKKYLSSFTLVTLNSTLICSHIISYGVSFSHDQSCETFLPPTISLTPGQRTVPVLQAKYYATSKVHCCDRSLG